MDFQLFMFLITYFIFLQKAYLIGVGGSQNRVVGNVLTKLMTFSTAALFCLKGQNLTKRRFDKTEIMDLVLGRFFFLVSGNKWYNLLWTSLNFLESIKSTRGVRLSEEDIKSKMGRWFKSAPKKIGKDDVESSESSDSDWLKTIKLF